MRELREELGVEAEPLERIPGEWPLKPGLVLQVWTARLVSGEAKPLEDHDELRWLGPHEIDTVDWLDQDRPAVAEAAHAAGRRGADLTHHRRCAGTRASGCGCGSARNPRIVCACPRVRQVRA